VEDARKEELLVRQDDLLLGHAPVISHSPI
jgi:hypothetical protein